MEALFFYEKARELVILKQRANPFMLQRVFGIGYKTAMEILGMLREEEVIGEYDGYNARKVLLGRRSLILKQ